MNYDTAQPAGHTIIEPLSTCLPRKAGPVRIIHDATLPRPLRVRDSAGVRLSKEVHQATSELLARIDEQLWPLPICYLGAQVPDSAGALVTLDARRLGALPRLFFARAATSEPLQGLHLEIRPRLRVLPGGGAQRTIEATLDVRTDDVDEDDARTREALRVFGEWATRTWSDAVASTLGPWILASGINELRLRGAMRPDRRQQLAVLSGGAWPQPRAH